MRSKLGLPLFFLLFFLLVFSVPLSAQTEPIPSLTVQPRPLPGGDIFPPYGFYNQFFPGPPNQNPPFDPMNSDPPRHHQFSWRDGHGIYQRSGKGQFRQSLHRDHRHPRVSRGLHWRRNSRRQQRWRNEIGSRARHLCRDMNRPLENGPQFGDAGSGS